MDSTGQKLIVDLAWKDGKATGFQTTGDPQAVHDEYQIKDGLYDGIHKSYYLDLHTGVPVLSKSESYKEGKLDGPTQEFSKDGKVVFERNYKQGTEIPNSQAASSPANSLNSGTPN